ncbi:DUF4932 domain-containing protein [Chitinophaga sp. Hz27]|uniref:DUF4932 domain-containing protein n=1 Tax=Chitinophaga sp. Hz27 TaxID=3347169 RepID=UPI0035DE50AD
MKKHLLPLMLLFATFHSYAQEKVSFSDAFKKENQGKYKIDIHEVKELIHIMIAITPSGIENDDMIQQQGDYYKDVLAYFKPFANEPIIKTFDSLMAVTPINYIFLTGNAFAYNFKKDKLEKSKVYLFPAASLAKMTIKENPITTYKTQIEAFAKKSNFRKFYNSHKTYYASIVNDYEKNANLGNQWKWLEKNFKNSINNYIVFCSPLINGLNYTGDFKNNNFQQIFMVLPPVDKLPDLTEKQNAIYNTRIMFTEIDHNYVGLPSDNNKESINQLFKDRNFWVNEKVYGISAYPNPIKVFDEYMTYGVFLLYIKEHYDDAAFTATTAELCQLMTGRGFPQMKLFTDNLLKVRAENPDKKIDDIYPAFLKLFEKQ